MRTQEYLLYDDFRFPVCAANNRTVTLQFPSCNIVLSKVQCAIVVEWLI